MKSGFSLFVFVFKIVFERISKLSKIKMIFNVFLMILIYLKNKIILIYFQTTHPQ